MTEPVIDAISITSIIREAVKIFKIEEIEGGLAKFYLQTRNFHTRNKFILELTENKRVGEVVNFLLEKDYPNTISKVEKAFELLIDENRRESEGVVYTPDFIVDYIVNTTIDKPGKIIDLSCGSGAFLLGSVNRLRDLTKLTLKEIVENYIYGIDIAKRSIRHAKIIIILHMVENGEDYEEVGFNLQVGDTMSIFNRNVPDSQTSPFDFEFDYVVGNPPYVRFQDLDEERRSKLSAGWKTVKGFNFNLHFVFFEMGLKVLKPTGKLGYIVPNNFFTTFAAENLRKFLHATKKIRRILNFNHIKVFPTASTYTCIVLLDKNWNEEHFEYAYLEDRETLSNLNMADLVKVRYDTLKDEKWRLLGEEEFENITKIENAGERIGNSFKIRVGIATLSDQVYFVDDLDDRYCVKDYDGRHFRIEKEVTRRLVKISRVSNEDDIQKSKLRIIFPYRKVGNDKFAIIDEEEMREKYPGCYEYLTIRRNDLGKRDKGKNIGPLWYAFGRTQGFDSHGPRLYTRTFSRGPNFIKDDGALFCNGYAIFINEDIDIYQKILNSRVMDYYMKKTSSEIEGDYQCYQKNYIEKFSIPLLSHEERSYISQEENKEKLDEFLFKKYTLKLL